MSKTRQWLALAVTLVLAVLVAGWFLVLAPERSEAAAFTAEADAQRLAAASLNTQLQMLRSQAADLPTQQARLAELQEAVPETTALPGLVRQLTAAADETGVVLESLSPGGPSQVGEYSQVPVALVVRGNFFLLEQFIASLEDLDRAFVVTGFSLAASSGEESRELQLSLSGNVFTLAAPSGAAAAAAAGAAGTAVTDASAGAPAESATVTGTATDAAGASVG